MPTLGNTPRPAYVYDTETDTWVPVGVGAHTHSDIPNTLVDAKGDLITATADNVPARLAKGADGTVLVSDSTTSTGLAWQPYGAIQPAGKNKIINGDFSIWQRGTSFTANNNIIYTADRWILLSTNTGGNVVGSRQAFTPGSAPEAGYEGSFFLRNTATSPTGASFNVWQQKIEDARTLAGQTVTLSFWAKADSSRTILSQFFQNFGTGGSTEIYTGTSYSYSLSTSWQRFTTTLTLPSVSGKTIGAGSSLRFEFVLPINVSSTVDIWGVQLEAGPIATPFTTSTGTIQGELSACQRYYWRTNRESQGSSSRITPYGIAQSTTAAEINFYLPTSMRTKPSAVEFANLRTYDGATLQVVTSVAIGDGSSTSINLGFTVASGLVQYRPTAVALNGDGYLALTAEL
jgi:hypothetical protein